MARICGNPVLGHTFSKIHCSVPSFQATQNQSSFSKQSTTRILQAKFLPQMVIRNFWHFKTFAFHQESSAGPIQILGARLWSPRLPDIILTDIWPTGLFLQFISPHNSKFAHSGLCIMNFFFHLGEKKIVLKNTTFSVQKVLHIFYF